MSHRPPGRGPERPGARQLLGRAGALVQGAVRLAVIALMTAITLVVFAQVLFRYALGWPLAWTEEVGRFGLIWLSFLGAAALVARSQHIAVTILTDLLPARGRALVASLADLAILVLLWIMLDGGLAIVRNEWAQRAPATSWPMGIVYLVIPISAALMLLWVAAGLLGRLAALRPGPGR
jgi:TRAP-type C4-dicarboxylate transport system permease small subunit